MPAYTTDAIRNVAILGSAGAGKTTLVEAMLFNAGVIGRMGRVEDGNTVCDYDDLEKEFRNSIDSALRPLRPRRAHINLIDTPGSADFLGKTISVLPAVETAVVVIDATAGIETVARRVMKRADEREPASSDRREQDRQCHGSCGVAHQHPGDVREHLPADQPARGWRQASWSTASAATGASDLGDVEPLPQRPRRPGRRGRRSADGAVPRAGRGKSRSAARPPSSGRCARAIWCPSASSPPARTSASRS